MTLRFATFPHSGEEYTSRLLLQDELVFVSAGVDQSAALDSSYIYVDHGDQFRRQHAEAFPDARRAQVTIAASDWALEYLLRTQSKGYLPARLVAPLLASGRLQRIDGAPSFPRRVYLVENARATRSWAWYEAAIAASSAR